MILFSYEESKLIFQMTFLALLLGVAIMDLRSFKISNNINLAVLSTALLYQLAFGSIFLSSLFALSILLLGFILYACRYLGAGDVKLLAAATLFIGPELSPSFLLFTPIFGGLLALFWTKTGTIRKAMIYYGVTVDPDVPAYIPYGIAICAGGFFTMLPQLLAL